MTALTLWFLFVRGSLFAACGGLLVIALRRASAAVRHAAWLGILVSLLVLPVWMLRGPRLMVPTQPSRVSVPLMGPGSVPIVAPPMVPLVKTTEPLEAASGTPVQSGSPIDFASLIAIAWAGAGLLVLGRLGWGLLAVGRIVRSATDFQAPAAALGTAQLIRGTRLLVHESVAVPATSGWLHPVILLPTSATGWSSERLTLVVAHEAAHIQRRDWLWQLLAQIACAVHALNPLAWFAASRLRAESELACDDLVLSLGYEPTGYAQELLDIARGLKRTPATVVCMARRPDVRTRLEAIVDSTRNRVGLTKKGVFVGATACLGLLMPFAVLRPLIGSPPTQNVLNPPAIPEVASEEIEKGVYLAQNGIAGLPNGLKIRLVGVKPERFSTAFWGTDDKPVPNADEWMKQYGNSMRFHLIEVGAMGKLPRTFVFEIQGFKDELASTTGIVLKPEPTTEIQRLNPLGSILDLPLNDVPLSAKEPIWGMVSLQLPQVSETATYRFGIAVGDWKTIAEVNNPYAHMLTRVHSAPREQGRTHECGLRLGKHPVLYFMEADTNRYNQTLLLGDKSKEWIGNVAQRAVLLDDSGTELPDSSNYPTSGEGNLNLSEEVLKKTARILLQQRDYQWVEFRDIPLRPHFAVEEAARLAPKIKGSATGVAKGFTRRFSNGVTLSITSIRRSRRDGDQWTTTYQPAWRADGLLLKDLPALQDYPKDVRFYGEVAPINVTADFKGDLQTNMRGMSVYHEWLGDLDASHPFNRPFRQPINSWFTQIEAVYKPTARVAHLRVGLASGPWSTIASQGQSFTEHPALAKPEDAPKPQQTGIEVLVGEDVKIGFAEDPKSIKRLSGPLGKVAVRVVAVLKSGEEVTLQSTSSRSGFGDVYHLPARHGEYDERYNHVLASELKEIRIQTRPFEWADFDNIALYPKD